MDSITHTQRMAQFVNAGLYLVTSESMSGGRTTLDVIGEALKGGALLIQLREKSKVGGALFELAVQVRRMTAEAGALLIINDSLDIAERCGADGVHLGLADMSLSDARKRAPDMIIGGSSHSLAEALAAQSAGASYVNIGPIYPTKTKDWKEEYLGLEAIKEISPSLTIPWTVMGGIKKQHIPGLVMAGARTIAVVTAVTMAEDIASETREILDLIGQFSKT